MKTFGNINNLLKYCGKFKKKPKEKKKKIKSDIPYERIGKIYPDKSNKKKRKAIKKDASQKIYLCLLNSKEIVIAKSRRSKLYEQQQKQEKLDMLMFISVSNHAKRRIEERFKYWGYTINDIHNDILNCDKWVVSKNGTKTVWGKIGKYVISADKILITVM